MSLHLSRQIAARSHKAKNAVMPAKQKLVAKATQTNLTVPDQLVLTPTTVDYAGIFDQLMTDLIAGGYWTDLAQAATGTTIARWIASVGAFAQGGIGRALQENYLDTARSPSGVFRGARLQGVHIIRSRPGSVNVSVVRTDNLATALVIPTMSQWNIGGQSFYNDTPITLSGTGASVNALLYRGTVQTTTMTSSGNAYQRYVLGSPGAWNISDIDVWAIGPYGRTWTAIRDGLWKYSGTDLVFFESTLPDGTVELKFGDGMYGDIPPAGTMTFNYVELASAASTANSIAIGSTGSAVGYAVTATTTSQASANQDPPKPEFYKAVGPGGPASKGVLAVTRDDCRAIALTYDGVVDAVFQGQAEVNPSDIRCMNVLYVTLLTTSVWSQTQWLQFKQWFEGAVGIATTYLVRNDPRAIPLTINMDIACLANASISSVTSMASQVITDYFAPSNTSLGMSLQPSDLTVAIMESATYLQAPGESGALIDYIRPLSPVRPVSAKPVEYFTLSAAPTLNVFYTQRKVSAAASGTIVGI